MSFEDKFEFLRNDDELYQKIGGSTGEDGVPPEWLLFPAYARV